MSILLNGGAPILAFKFAVSESDIKNFLKGSVSFGLFADAIERDDLALHN